MTCERFLANRIILHCGDCRAVLAGLDPDSIDAVVTDPPYHLISIGDRFGGPNAKPPNSAGNVHQQYNRLSRGFMGKQWDGGAIAFDPETWRAVARVLKPGGHLLAMGGTRTFHRLACAIEDAGFEIRDTISWNFGFGFPKSHDVGKKLDGAELRCSCNRVRDVRHAGASATVADQEDDGDILQLLMQEQDVCGSSAAFRSEWIGQEATGQGIEGGAQSGMEGRGNVSPSQGQLRERALREMPAGTDLDGSNGRLRDGASLGNGADHQAAVASNGMRSPPRPSAIEQHAEQSGIVAMQSQPQERGAWPRCGRCGKPIVPDGLGTALKPAMELICLARKPLSEGTVAANVLRWGTGAINVDGCRVAHDEPEKHTTRTTGKFAGVTYAKDDYSINMDGGTLASANAAGRWPANVAHDGSAEVTAAFPETADSTPGIRNNNNQGHEGWSGGTFRSGPLYSGHSDSGSAARFFYTAKADADDRLGSKHPTVKPLDLMQWLVRLVTPKGGTVLDPFAGTGTTGEAAWREGANAVLIEAEPEYQADIRRRLALALAGPDERIRESVKARNLPRDDGPLFDRQWAEMWAKPFDFSQEPKP